MAHDETSLRLVRPHAGLEPAFWALVADFERAGDTRLQQDAMLARRSFAQLLRHFTDAEEGMGLPDGIVPEATYWLVRADTLIVGITTLRLRLTPALEDVGGHIGYVIAPSERRKKYGTAILAQMLLVAHQRGFARVLLTCDTSNVASARIIEHNGGILVTRGFSERRGAEVARYWITL